MHQQVDMEAFFELTWQTRKCVEDMDMDTEWYPKVEFLNVKKPLG